MLKFMFEKDDHVNFTEQQKGYGPQRRNFTESRDTAGSGGMSRYDVSPLVETLIRAYTIKDKYKNISLHDLQVNTLRGSPDAENYVISVGVNHSPTDWTGPPITGNVDSLFEDLHPKYLKDLQDNKALLLIDQTHEGYSHELLYPWFYSEAKKYNINPNRLIYTSGDLNSIKTHDAYADSCHWAKEDRMFVQPYAAFQWMIWSCQKMRKLETNNFRESIDAMIQYKQDNLESIKAYNCLQKRPRGHRCLVWKELYDNDLVKHGIVSTNKPDSRYTFAFEERPPISQEEYDILCKDLPLIHGYDTEQEDEHFVDPTGGHFITKLNLSIMRDSFVSVVSEASFGDIYGQGQCFLSEKTFKPISAFHPFIIIGDRGSLAYIKEMGYKTFDKWWDESYDTLPTWERLEAITNIIKKLSSMDKTELLKMYIDMEDVLVYNYNKLNENCDSMFAPQAVSIVQHIRSKF